MWCGGARLLRCRICEPPAMEPGRRTMSGGYANNPPPGMGHIRAVGGHGSSSSSSSQQQQEPWSLSHQMNQNRGGTTTVEDWTTRGSPRSLPQQQNNGEQQQNWGVGAVGEGRPPSLSSYSWSMSNERGDLVGLSSSPHVNGNLDNLDSIRGIDSNSFSTSFPAIFDKCKAAQHPFPFPFFSIPLKKECNTLAVQHLAQIDS